MPWRQIGDTELILHAFLTLALYLPDRTLGIPYSLCGKVMNRRVFQSNSPHGNRYPKQAN